MFAAKDTPDQGAIYARERAAAEADARAYGEDLIVLPGGEFAAYWSLETTDHGHTSLQGVTSTSRPAFRPFLELARHILALAEIPASLNPYSDD
jgi:hypothetical protein